MGDVRPGTEPGPALDRTGYELEVDETFEDRRSTSASGSRPTLPHWSSQAASAARYAVGGGRLELRIDADQQPWAPEFDGGLRVSSFQTGVFSGPVGSRIGQLQFREGLIVREAQPSDGAVHAAVRPVRAAVSRDR